MSNLNDFKIENGVLVQYYGNDAVVTIPDDVTSIGDYAFRGCENLHEIIIPDSVTEIGFGVFKGCCLQEITIQNSIVSIDILCYSDIFCSGEFSFEDGPFWVSNIPLVDSSFLRIFMKNATPNLIFNTIKDLFNGKVDASCGGDDLCSWIDYLDDTLLEDFEECGYNKDEYCECCGAEELVWDAISENPEWIPDFIEQYSFNYSIGGGAEGFCTIDLSKYAKAHNKLYMFKLEILSAFIEKLGTAQETDTIIATILDATKILADNHANKCISKLLTDDIYKNLWFDDNIKTKVSNLIK